MCAAVLHPDHVIHRKIAGSRIDEKVMERMRIVGEVHAELNVMEIRSVPVTAIRKTVMERYTVY